MPTTTRSSDRTRLGQLIVAEGPPGAGKTTALDMLAVHGRTVIGEYTTAHGATIPIADHPAVDADDAHQRNWLIKHTHAQQARRRGPVYLDRDWVSALAYAYSLDDDGRLFTQRTHWAHTHLDQRTIAVASTYVIFHVDPTASLHRRQHRLTPDHPWSTRPGLQRLVLFYDDPVAAVADTHPRLANRMRAATWRHLHGHTLQQAAHVLNHESHQR